MDIRVGSFSLEVAIDDDVDQSGYGGVWKLQLFGEIPDFWDIEDKHVFNLVPIMQVIAMFFEFFSQWAVILEKNLGIYDVLNPLKLIVGILYNKLVAFWLTKIVSIDLLIHFWAKATLLMVRIDKSKS